MSTITVKHGTHLGMRAMPVAQDDSWSFHLLLHHFASACLGEVARRPLSSPASDIVDHTRQAKERLRREVVYCLVLGVKTYSELAEIHHVLPLRDNIRIVPLSLDLIFYDWIESRVLVYVSHTHTLSLSLTHTHI